MKFTTATVLAAATGVMAGYAHDNVTYTTEVVEVYTTYCPEPTEITHGDKTYTVTEPTTLTITDCPCTISKPVITTSIVECHDCPKPTEEPKPEPPVVSEEPKPEPPVSEEPKPEPPVSEKPKPQPPVSLPVPQPPSNATSTLETYYPTGAPSATEEPSEVPTAGAGKAAAFSGLGLAGVLGLAVFAL